MGPVSRKGEDKGKKKDMPLLRNTTETVAESAKRGADRKEKKLRRVGNLIIVWKEKHAT